MGVVLSNDTTNHVVLTALPGCSLVVRLWGIDALLQAVNATISTLAKVYLMALLSSLIGATPSCINICCSFSLFFLSNLEWSYPSTIACSTIFSLVCPCAVPLSDCWNSSPCWYSHWPQCWPLCWPILQILSVASTCQAILTAIKA